MMQTPTNNLSVLERRATFSLASIFALRMLGLFMILPVFALYTQHFNTTPFLIGIALGVYGLTQAALQIPFGMWSDHIGRKPVIAFGLVLFAFGSILAGFSHTIWGVIIGRSLQGAGAVGSTTLALAADLIRPELRARAMATIGMTIGISFSLAMILGPLLNGWIHIRGIFWLTAVLAFLGIAILFSGVPAPQKIIINPEVETIPADLPGILRNTELLRLNFCVLVLHAILTATFIAVPAILQTFTRLPEQHQWYLYFPILILAFFAAVPLIIIAEKKAQIKTMMLTAIAILIFSQVFFWLWHSSMTAIVIALLLFFTAFTLLEAILPSAVSKTAPAQRRGTAIGIYSSCQFLGIFIGGSAGGWLVSHFALNGIVFAAIMLIIGIIWFWLATGIKNPLPRKT